VDLRLDIDERIAEIAQRVGKSRDRGLDRVGVVPIARLGLQQRLKILRIDRGELGW